jgi:ATP-dependent RNA helicase DeaD
VQPGAIVGAIANEGGLVRADFGHIDIQLDHTIVELPATLPDGTLEALANTRISGKLIGLAPADGVHPAGKPPRKPRRPSY